MNLKSNLGFFTCPKLYLMITKNLNQRKKTIFTLANSSYPYVHQKRDTKLALENKNIEVDLIETNF